RIGDVPARLVADRYIGVIEIHIVQTTHAEPFHQAPASLVALRGDGDHAITGKILPCPRQRCRGGFARVTLPPGVFAQAPADFGLAFDRRRVPDFETTETQQRAVA